MLSPVVRPCVVVVVSIQMPCAHKPGQPINTALDLGNSAVIDETLRTVNFPLTVVVPALVGWHCEDGKWLLALDADEQIASATGRRGGLELRSHFGGFGQDVRVLA